MVCATALARKVGETGDERQAEVIGAPAPMPAGWDFGISPARVPALPLRADIAVRAPSLRQSQNDRLSGARQRRAVPVNRGHEKFSAALAHEHGLAVQQHGGAVWAIKNSLQPRPFD